MDRYRWGITFFLYFFGMNAFEFFPLPFICNNFYVLEYYLFTVSFSDFSYLFFLFDAFQSQKLALLSHGVHGASGLQGFGASGPAFLFKRGRRHCRWKRTTLHYMANFSRGTAVTVAESTPHRNVRRIFQEGLPSPSLKAHHTALYSTFFKRYRHHLRRKRTTLHCTERKLRNLFPQFSVLSGDSLLQSSLFASISIYIYVDYLNIVCFSEIGKK